MLLILIALGRGSKNPPPFGAFQGNLTAKDAKDAKEIREIDHDDTTSTTGDKAKDELK
jgi:hypothetical protein